MKKTSTIARCLARFVEEHGVPNRFSPGEVSIETSLTPMEIGLMARNNISEIAGYMPGYSVEYDHMTRHFVVNKQGVSS
jgi:hypothetical protein